MSLPNSQDTVWTVSKAVGTGRTYKVYLAIGVCIGLGLYVAWLTNFEPVHSFINDFILNISSVGVTVAEKAQVWANDAGAYFTANPVPATIGIVTAAGTVYGLISKVQADRARAETERYTNEQIMETQRKLVETSQQHLLATQEIGGLKEKLSAYENDTSFIEAKQLIADQATQLRTKADEVSTLEKLITDLKLKEKTVIA
jgi:hypothetical protein